MQKNNLSYLLRLLSFITLSLSFSYLPSAKASAAPPDEEQEVQEVHVDSIANFEVVTPNLWRGAVPSDEGLQKLANKGVSTIVDLRMYNGASQKESRAAKKLGLKYIHLPMGYLAPSKNTVKEFFSAVADNNDGITYVHCHQGADRTGTLVAMYRVLVEKWQYQEAYQEMRAHHFKPWLFTLKEKIEITSSPNYQPDARLSSILALCCTQKDHFNLNVSKASPSLPASSASSAESPNSLDPGFVIDSSEGNVSQAAQPGS